jgi:exosortase A-associated hydrolase 2
MVIATPLFLENAKRRTFAIYHEPDKRSQPRGSLIYVPPFAEEMNLSRRTVALQARMLAAAGTSVLVLDLFGTGDSAGDFSEAQWELWIEDVLAAADWLEVRGRTPTALWGLRLGGLIGVAVAASRPGRFKHLLLWQPIPFGKNMLTQFLRIRMAASMHEGGAIGTTERLRAELAQNGSIEVAGYELSLRLATALDDIRMDRLDLEVGTHVDWFEVGSGEPHRASAVTDRIAEMWRRKGATVSTMRVAGEQFWTIPEAATPTDLLSATTRKVEAWPTP